MNSYKFWKRKEKDVSPDRLTRIKLSIELILKADIAQDEKIKLLMRYAVSPKEVLYPNVKIMYYDGTEVVPAVEYGNQLIIRKYVNGKSTYLIKAGMLWGRGLLHSELDEL